MSAVAVVGSLNIDLVIRAPHCPKKGETVIVLESTANGVGDYFHDEWLRAQMERSDKQPVFVPWHEIEIYRRPVSDAAALRTAALA